MAFENLPYTDFHNLNLDWVLQTTKDLLKTWLEYNTKWESWKDDIESKFDDLVKYFHDNLPQTVYDELLKMSTDGTLETVIRPIVNEYAKELYDNMVSNQWVLENGVKFNDFLGVRVTLYSNDEVTKVKRDVDKIKACGFNRLRVDAWWDELANFSSGEGFPILGFDGTCKAIQELYALGFALDINITANQNMTSNDSKFPKTQDELFNFSSTVGKFIVWLYSHNIKKNVRIELWNEPETFGVTPNEYLLALQSINSLRYPASIYDTKGYELIVGNTAFIPDALIKKYIDIGVLELSDGFNIHPYSGSTFTENPSFVTQRYLEYFSNISYKKGVQSIAGEYGFKRSGYITGYAVAQTMDLLRFGFKSANYFALYGDYGVLLNDGSDTQISKDFTNCYKLLKNKTFVQTYETSHDYVILEFIELKNNKYVCSRYGYSYSVTGVTSPYTTFTTNITHLDNMDNDKNTYRNSYDEIYVNLFKMRNAFLSKGQINGNLKGTLNLSEIKDNGAYIYFSGGNDVPVQWLQNDYGLLLSFNCADYILHIAYSGLGKSTFVNFSSDRGSSWRGWKQIKTNDYGHNTNIDLTNIVDDFIGTYSGGYSNGMVDSNIDFGIISHDAQNSDVGYSMTRLTSFQNACEYINPIVGGVARDWYRLKGDFGKDLIHPNFDNITKNGVYTFHSGFSALNMSGDTTSYGVLRVTSVEFYNYLLQEFFNANMSNHRSRVGVINTETGGVDWKGWM